MPSDRLPAVAYVDESGDRGLKQSSSPHFVLAGIVLPESRRPEAGRLLLQARKDLQRRPQDELHWKNYTSHTQRLRMSALLGQQPFGLMTAVVVCKRHLPLSATFTSDHMYMFALRLLLERISWLSRERGVDVECTIAHTRNFRVETLRNYEAQLRGMNTEIKWAHIARRCQISSPKVEEMLQLADATASAIGAAFNPDLFGETETRYLERLRPRIYCGPQERGPLTSYGLKMHPWDPRSRAAYPWVAAL